MNARIGVWPTLPWRAYAGRRRQTLPFPFGESSCRLYARARVALWHALRALLRPGDDVLVPAYHHGSEVEAILRADLGVRFYGGDAVLAPDEGELEGLLDENVKALYLIHALGLPQDAPRWRAWCDERGLLLIEDAAQAWLADVEGRPVGSWGDASIFCLYKTFGVPDGSAVVAPGRSLPEARGSSLGLEALARRHASRELGRFDAVEALHRRARARRPADLREEFELGDVEEGPARVSRALLPRVFEASAAAARRRNYAYLLAELGELVPEPFRRLPAGASPFAFLVASDLRGELLERLDRGLVTPLLFWADAHPALPQGRFPAVDRLRETVVGLPVHQDVSERELERVVSLVRGATR